MHFLNTVYIYIKIFRNCRIKYSIESFRIEKQKELTENRGLFDNHKRCNICVMGKPEKEKKGKCTEEIFETIMTDTFFQINVRHQTQKVQGTPGRMNTSQNYTSACHF